MADERTRGGDPAHDSANGRGAPGVPGGTGASAGGSDKGAIAQAEQQSMTGLMSTANLGNADDRREIRRVIFFLRGVLAVLLVAMALLTILTDSAEREAQLFHNWPVVVVATLFFFSCIIAIDVFTPRRKLSTVSGLFLGLFIGVIASALVSLVIDLLAQTYGADAPRLIALVKVGFGLGICYLTMTTVVQTQDDFRLVIPYVEFSKQIRGPRPILIDTSVLIDGRIADVGETGLIQSPLIVPRFVLNELQALSDSSDRTKRTRGRRGLDMVTRLQRSPHLDVSIHDASLAGKGVDQQLIELARMLPAAVMTTDSGLARMAGIHSVQVFNLHEVAAALRPSVIPGDAINLQLMRRGEQPGQAVGYLEDGTMVVAENGEPMIGQQVTLTVTSAMQTSAGRLIFGRLGGTEQGGGEARAPAGTSRKA